MELPLPLLARIRGHGRSSLRRLRQLHPGVVPGASHRRSVNPILAVRQLSLGGVAVLAVVIALAIAHQRSESGSAANGLPQPVAAAPADWSRALAGVGPIPKRVSACGGLLKRGTLGVTHPVLPCGAKIFVAYRGREALTQVIDRGPSKPGREFELTPTLAAKLHLQGVQTIRWTFARA